MLFTVISVFKVSDAVSDERTAVASELNGLDGVNRLLAQRHASPTVYERHIIIDTGGNLAVVHGHDEGKHIHQGEVLHPAHRAQFQQWYRAERQEKHRANLAALRHHVTGAIERGEAEPIVEQPGKG